MSAPARPKDLSAAGRKLWAAIVTGWELADHEVLDPEGPEEMFESLTKRSLFRRMRRVGR